MSTCALPFLPWPLTFGLETPAINLVTSVAFAGVVLGQRFFETAEERMRRIAM